MRHSLSMENGTLRKDPENSCHIQFQLLCFRQVIFIPQILTGADLLAKVKELSDCAKTDLARGCGYVVTKKDGKEQVKFTQFYEALLEAKDLSFTTGTAGIGKGGRKLSYNAVVQGNGNLLIDKAYTAILELQPGVEYEIKLGRKQIRLIPVGGSEEEE